MEAINVKKHQLISKEDHKTLSYFEEPICRRGERYEVRLRWKKSLSIEDNKEAAVERLLEATKRNEEKSSRAEAR